MRKTFSNIIGIDIKSFLNDCLNFIESYNQTLIDYYESGTDFPKTAFDTLDSLSRTLQDITHKISINRNQLTLLSDFEVVDSLENFKSFFLTIENYSRWLKSSLVSGKFKNDVEIKYCLRQNQTLESLSREIGWTDDEQGFLDLSLRNAIKETDYDLNKSLIFNFSYQGSKAFVLNSVVDEMVGERILGKDIQKKLQIFDNDLLTLAPEMTFQQSCEILTRLIKNSNPEFPLQGFDKSAISNKNIISNRLPTFIRQLYSVVGSDDTIAQFQVVNTSLEGDCLKIDIEYKSHLNSTSRQTVYGN